MEVIKKELVKKVDKASEVYAQNTTLRALINLIPYIGGTLDVILASKGKAIVQERIEEFIKNLSNEMNQLRNESIDKDYLESEEFLDLIIKGFEAAARTRDKEKIRLYAKILRGAVTIQDRKEHSPEEYLAVLAELTSREIEVASAIYEQQSDSPKEGENELEWVYRKGWKKLPEQCLSVSKEDMPFILLRLQKSGLIRDISAYYLDMDEGVFVITEVFRKIVNYLKKVD